MKVNGWLITNAREVLTIASEVPRCKARVIETTSRTIYRAAV